MTEPTWKDPLLREWWAECISADPLFVNAFAAADLAPYPGVSPATMLVLLCGHGWASDARGKLRSLIDAELARGREAVELLREVEYPYTSHNIGEPVCHFCGWSDPEYEPPLDIKLSKVGHSPDCRLARLLTAPKS